MKRLCVFVLLLTLSSCELDTQADSAPSDNPRETQLNQAIQPIEQLSSAQKQTARRVCSHLRSQRLRLRSLPNGTEQYFRTEERTCPDGQLRRNQVRAELQSNAAGPYWQTGQSVNLHSPILTDRSSVFDQLCDDLDAGLEVENTQLISSRQIQFSIRPFSDAGLDTVKLVTYEMDRGAWRAKRIDEYDINRGNDDPNDQGQTLAQQHQYFCRDAQRTGRLWQKAF